VGRIDRTLRTRLNLRLERLDLTTPGYTMLFVLRRVPGLSNAELARTAGMTPQSSILTLRALVERGLIERRPSTSHKRVLNNFLTPAGFALIDQCEAEAAEIEATMLNGFGGHEREQVERLLRRCAENLGINL
jgi:DNA-binding MarR family transcriptional regulator